MITVLTITYDDQTGNVNVNGPVQNKGLCYMLLECARDAVKDNVDRAQQPEQPLIVTPPANAFDGFVRGGKTKRRR